MQCPDCQATNREGARFCRECGGPLAAACPSCGARLEPGGRFCDGCGAKLDAQPGAGPFAANAAAIATPANAPESGRFAERRSYTPKHLAEKILTSKASLEGERKQVTVLFADLKGSMELLAERDPEDARGILDPVLERMMEAVHRYEGTVNQVMGDGIMALFGAPLAHEDHAVRACYAALRMQETVKSYAEEMYRAHGVPLQIRVGLNSGEVVVRAIGSDLAMDYTAVGQTTHLAARMEQMAMPGSILIAPQTLALAEGYVTVKSLGAMPIKGAPAPIEVFEVVGVTAVRSRLQATAARGLTRFVGRDTEIDQLRQAIESARSGRGQIVAVVGEPGVGKSRLFWEFTHSHRTQGWLVVESSSVSYGKATAFLPLIDLLRTYFQIEARDDARRIREKVTGKVLSLDRALEPSLNALLWLLDAPIDDVEWHRLDPPQRRQQTLDGIRRLLLREAQVQPLLVLFEDLHWIDDETQALLDGLVESLPTARLLLLVNYRPEYRHAWGGKSYYRQLRIDPLAPASVQELLEALLGADGELAPLRQLLIERTEGNPFFLEESIRTLVETKALVGERGAYRLARATRSLQIPATAQAILAARIDRLTPQDKRLLQAASVIGKDVALSLLRVVAESSEEDLRRSVSHLQAAEFLYEARLFPDLEYTFKHALIHEVAYAGLVQERRRALHRRVMEAIEQVYADRASEQLERLADHAFRGEAWEKAASFAEKAGARAFARSANRDAVACFEQALTAVGELPESRDTLVQGFEIRLELRRALTQLAQLQAALKRLREAEAIAERLDDDQRRARVCSVLMTLHTLLGELDEAVATGTRALEMASRLEDLRLRILTTSYLEQAQYYRGEYGKVVRLARDALAILPAEWAHEHFGMIAPASVYSRSWLVISLAELGRFVEARGCAAEALALARETNHAYTVGLAHRAAGTLNLLAGDWTKARSLLERGITALRQGSVSLSLPATIAGSAWALAQLGEADEALSRLREGDHAVTDHLAAGMRRAWDDHVLGRTYLLLGRIDEARRLGERAVGLVSSQPGGAAHAFHLLGDIACHAERFDAEQGEAHYRRSLALAEPRGMRPLVAHCHLGLGRLCHRTGRAAPAQEHMRIATATYRDMAMDFWHAQAEAAMSRLA